MDAEQIFVFERDSAGGVAASRICFKISLKELIPTKGFQINNVHEYFSKGAAARSLHLQPAIYRRCIELRFGVDQLLDWCEDTNTHIRTHHADSRLASQNRSNFSSGQS